MNCESGRLSGKAAAAAPVNSQPAGSLGPGFGAEKLLESAVCVGSAKRPAPSRAPMLTGSLFSPLALFKAVSQLAGFPKRLGGFSTP